MPTSNFDFYSKAAYFQDIARRIAETKAGDRVALATMTFEPDLPHIANLLQALGEAGSRGVHVNLSVDAHVFLRAHSKQLSQKIGPLFFDTQALKHPEKLTGVYARKYAVLEKLRSQGGRYTITNQPRRIFSNPVGGRSHIKFGIVNDRVYIGGCNMDKPSDIDIMTAWDDRQLADQLFTFSNDVLEHAGTSFMNGLDRRLTTDNGDRVYIDAGKKRQSIILEQALQLIDEAKDHLFMTCQYFPNSLTAKHLTAAQERGVKVTIIYNHASKFPKPDHILQHISANLERLRRPSELFKGQLPLSSPYIHAKVIANESAAMVGSHNYIPAGVNFGTAEIALLRRDADFSRQIIASIQSTINSAQS